MKIPAWNSDLKTWRDENQCTDEKWDAYAAAAQKRVKYVSIVTAFWIAVISIILTCSVMKLWG